MLSSWFVLKMCTLYSGYNDSELSVDVHCLAICYLYYAFIGYNSDFLNYGQWQEAATQSIQLA